MKAKEILEEVRKRFNGADEHEIAVECCAAIVFEIPNIMKVRNVQSEGALLSIINEQKSKFKAVYKLMAPEKLRPFDEVWEIVFKTVASDAYEVWQAMEATASRKTSRIRKLRR